MQVGYKKLPRVTLNPDFKVMPLFDVEQLRNGRAPIRDAQFQ